MKLSTYPCVSKRPVFFYRGGLADTAGTTDRRETSERAGGGGGEERRGVRARKNEKARGSGTARIPSEGDM